MLSLLKNLFVRPGPSLSPRQAHARASGNALLIDVRESSEFARGRPAGAISVPLSRLRGDGPAALPALPSGKDEILLICQSGMRSRVAQSLLKARLEVPCSNVDGGLMAWVRHGLPVEQ